MTVELLVRTSAMADESFECKARSSVLVRMIGTPLISMRCFNAAGDENGVIKKIGYPARMIPRIDNKQVNESTPLSTT